VDIAGEEECWNWKGRLTGNNYGGFVCKKIGGEGYAHRVSWIIHFGKIPKRNGYHGTCVCHKCDNRLCVNPNHLFLGSCKDNIHDMIKKGRYIQTPFKGEKNGRAKLTNNKMQNIRIMLKAGIFQEIIADIFGVKQTIISKIKLGQLWASVK
jgi:hypothetical protein